MTFPVVVIAMAAVAAGLFAGAAIYVTAVEHPARLSCGVELALREFAPSYKRGTVMQASLAVLGCVAAIIGGWQQADPTVIVAGLLLGSVVPFTLIVILPTNNRLLDPTLDPKGAEVLSLLTKWGRLHAVRSVLGSVAFVILLARIVLRGAG